MYKVTDKFRISLKDMLLEIKSVYNKSQMLQLSNKNAKGEPVNFYRVILDGLDVMINEEMLEKLINVELNKPDAVIPAKEAPHAEPEIKSVKAEDTIPEIKTKAKSHKRSK